MRIIQETVLSQVRMLSFTFIYFCPWSRGQSLLCCLLLLWSLCSQKKGQLLKCCTIIGFVKSIIIQSAVQSAQKQVVLLFVVLKHCISSQSWHTLSLPAAWNKIEAVPICARLSALSTVCRLKLVMSHQPWAWWWCCRTSAQPLLCVLGSSVYLHTDSRSQPRAVCRSY